MQEQDIAWKNLFRQNLVIQIAYSNLTTKHFPLEKSIVFYFFFCSQPSYYRFPSIKFAEVRFALARISILSTNPLTIGPPLVSNAMTKSSGSGIWLVIWLEQLVNAVAVIIAQKITWHIWWVSGKWCRSPTAECGGIWFSNWFEYRSRSRSRRLW